MIWVHRCKSVPMGSKDSLCSPNIQAAGKGAFVSRKETLALLNIYQEDHDKINIPIVPSTAFELPMTTF